MKNTPDVPTRLCLAFGDRHAPFHDPRVDDLVLEIIKDLQPDLILDGGDGIDAICLSRFPKDHDELIGLSAELDLDYQWRRRIQAAAPKASRILLECNHFTRRLEDLKKDGAWWMAELDALTQENLFRLAETGWDLRTEWLWPADRPKLLAIHGDGAQGIQSSRSPVNAVRSISRENGISVLRFHSHVSGLEISRRWGETTFACQVGCLCDLTKQPKYTKHGTILSNWSNSIALLYLGADGRALHIELVPIVNGTAFLGGKQYGTRRRERTIKPGGTL